MSDEADRLAEMARNRGLKLRRSRVRSPHKPGFGMFGLTDTNGEPVFGIRGKRALRATADEIETYLRSAEVGDWKASLKASGGRPPATKTKKKPAKAKVPAPVPTPKPPKLRTAKNKDADALVSLFALLGHEISSEQIRRNLKLMSKAGGEVLLLAASDALLGACGIQASVHPHRSSPVGRITILVVAEGQRGKGLGRQLLLEAERRLAELGCELIEVTSNDRLFEAHNFYKHMGYERTSVRFAKRLATG